MSSSLFGIIASAFFFSTSGNLSFGVSATNVDSDIETSDPSGSSAPMSFDENMNRLTLEGLDPSVPLTDDEAAFLESAIQEVINEFHEAAGIDLYAEDVSVGTHAVAIRPNATDEDSNHLRGRKLEREMTGTPQIDNYCWFPPGHPKAGEWRPGCEFDIDLYVCCRCWMCIDDDETAGWKWRPTPEPVEGPRTRKPTPLPTLSFRDNMKLMADDDDFDRPTKEPTSKPTVKPTAMPTTKPTIKPTGKPTGVELEKERGPKDPFGPRRPGFRRHTNNGRNNFNNALLDKLKKSPFTRLNRARRARFGYRN